jgi:2-dehydropantoate 2-reductase
MRHAVLGAGAIGGLMAAALKTVGEDVTLIVRAGQARSFPEHLAVEHPAGTLRSEALVAERVDAKFDVLWIATKTYQLEEALKSVDVQPGIVVPLLNGTEHLVVLRARFGDHGVVPGTIAVEAERSAAGVFVQRSPVRLNVAASGEAALRDVFERLRGLGWTCRFIADEPTLMWSKLAFLEPFALVTAASGKSVGEVLADPGWKATFQAAIAEACGVAVKEGAEVDAEKGLAAFAAFPATMRASMAKDLAAGRKLELDGIAGPVLRGGMKHGVPTPVTRRLVEMIEGKK